MIRVVGIVMHTSNLMKNLFLKLSTFVSQEQLFQIGKNVSDYILEEQFCGNGYLRI